MDKQERLMNALGRCESYGYCEDRQCPYYDNVLCLEMVRKDALELLKAQEWISVKDRLPTEHDTIFAKLKGTDKWKTGMFEKQSDDVRVVCQFEDGTRRVWHDHTVDGIWDCEKENRYPKRTVTYWCENPQLPEV